MFLLRRRGRDWSSGAGLRLLAAMELTTAAGSAAPRLICVCAPRDGAVRGIAAGVLFLASPDASCITGATPDIDGGYDA